MSGPAILAQLDQVVARVRDSRTALDGLDRALVELRELLAGSATAPSTAAHATVLAVGAEQRIRLDWVSGRTDVTGWRVGRDGLDAAGDGPSSATVAAAARAVTFPGLRPDTAYHLSLTPLVGDQAGTTIILVASTGAAPAPPAPAPDTAAGKLGWGLPDWRDEFDVPGPPDPARWVLPPVGGGPGPEGNGQRMADNAVVGNGMLTLRGEPDGRTGWVRQRAAVTYGRWEWRCRSRNTGSLGDLYHPRFLVEPADGRHPQSGRYDALVCFGPNALSAGGFLYYPHDPGPVQQESWRRDGVDCTQWHNWAFEWAPDGLRGWLDGAQIYHFVDGARPGRRAIQAMPAGFGGFTLDASAPANLRPAVLEVAWIRFWSV